ncbi:hypothetical protein [Microlunatus parietis]|uniref:Uncharacterized protein n=1 Tax=Microlunatus parietis TaxID=682979 RepID=A0A7Y9ICN9_9ACTN|nr:hypothetical protein [Microlunatus parietis]
MLINFVDPAMEGKAEWVPPGRLKVPWDQAESFHAREARWNAVLAESPHDNDLPEVVAANTVFEQVVDYEVADIDWRESYLRIDDLDRLCGLSGLPRNLFTSDPLGFQAGGTLIVTWQIALKTAQALAKRHAGPLLEHVEQEERDYLRESIHGSYHHGRGGRTMISPEIIREVDQKYRPARNLVREWCGVEAVSRWEELAALRAEIRRVGDIAEEAIQRLGKLGHADDAEDLAAKLGQTLGTLRTRD